MVKTHLQHVAIAAAINVDRIVAWLDERPRATTRTSRFAALAPACTRNPGEAAASGFRFPYTQQPVLHSASCV